MKTIFNPKLSRARPELVEGYPRALEDILQQVQDERDGKLRHSRIVYNVIKVAKIFTF